MDHPFDEMSLELQEKIAKTTVALLDKQTIPQLTQRLRKAGDHYAVFIGFRSSYVSNHWFIWLDGNPTDELEFDTFDELEKWVEKRCAV